ncbi:MAG: ABC transporter ATP-binding protein [Anaerolineales bacterium]|nr:ABC transporter ATP-binding protein [Anaerolineales bacterium]
MKSSWFQYFKQGLSRTQPSDRIAGGTAYEEARINLRNLRPYVDRHKRKFIFGAGLILLTLLLVYPQPLINRYLIDNVILDRQLARLFGVVLLLAGLKVAEKIINALQNYYFAQLEQEVLLDIQGDLLDRTLHFPKSFFDEQETGYLMSRLLSDVQGLRWFFSSTLVSVLSNMLRFLGGVVLLIYLKWQLAIIALVVIPGMVLLVRTFYRQLRILSHQSMEQQANVSRQLQETLSTTALIKAFASEKRSANRVITEWDAYRQLAMERASVGSVGSLVVNLLPDIARGLVLMVGAYWIIQGDWTLGSLLAFISYLGFVYGPAKFLAAVNMQLQDALASLERVSALFDIVPEDNIDCGLLIDRLGGDIEFRNVSFSYAGHDLVLENLSCHIHPGEHVAIVGPSGVGKTTLVSLILRFYKPTSGNILFDGRPADEYQSGSLRRRIGYVSQSTLLLSGSIADNLRYGNPGATQDQLERAAEMAGIHDFIMSLDGGYESRVGEKGVNLSAGQKQRMAIARALVIEPDILVLDEPASALDSLVEKVIFDTLPEMMREKTIFVVAHRPTTIRSADRILLLNERRLVATGTHQQLLESNDYYRSLVGG